MMDKDLENFLARQLTLEMMDVVKSAAAVFELFELDDYDGASLDMVYSIGLQEPSVVTDRILAELRQNLVYILGLHSITVVDTAHMSMLVTICKGIKVVTEYEDMDAIIDICDGEETAAERLAEVVSLMTGESVEEVMLCLEGVDERILVNIRALVRQTTDHVEDFVGMDQVDAINRYRELISPAVLSYQTMIEAGMPLGMTYDTYWKHYSGTNKTIDLNDKLHLKQFVQDIIGMMLISSDALANPIMQFQKTMTELTSDLKINMQADAMAKELLQRMINEKA
jgi:hypothetical protein